MEKISNLAIFSSIFLLIILLVVPVFASITVGVKNGDWIEYDISILTNQFADTGFNVPFDHNITWARMEVITVQENTVSLNIQTQFSNGTIISGNIVLNLENGVLGDDFIIPANLALGDSFFDLHQGNITITNIEQSNIAGAQRTVLFGSTNETTYQWDQTTGILIKAETTYPTYTMLTQAKRTNLWEYASVLSSSESPLQSDIQIFGLDLKVVFALAVGVISVLVIAISIIVIRRRPIKLDKPQT